MGDKDSKAGLAGRVKALGVDSSNVKRVELGFETKLPVTEFLNKPGQALSMQIYRAIARKGSGVIGPLEASRGLKIYGRELLQETVAGANHPGVSLLEGIAIGVMPPIKVEAIQHNELEVLPRGRAAVLREIAETYGTPVYAYFESELEKAFDKFKRIPAPGGITIRLAAKANTNGAIVNWFAGRYGGFDANFHTGFDACTTEEEERLEHAGIPSSRIRLVSKQVPDKIWLQEHAKHGLKYTACSPTQLENFGKALPGYPVGIRFNIGIGSGFSPQVSTGGLGSPFGILYPEKKGVIDKLLNKYGLILDTVHYHIGAGADPEKQKEALARALEIAEEYASVRSIDTGGSFRVARVRGEKETDIREMGRVMAYALKEFRKKTGRELHLEVEPGTALLANAGYLVFTGIDKVDTGERGETFVVLDGGMNCNSRIPLYGAQHPLYNLAEGRRRKEQVIFVGPECESGSVATVRRGQPEVMDTRTIREVRRGDYVAMGGVGAYCGSSMTLQHYNSLPNGPQVFVRINGRKDLIRARQPLEDLWKDERIPKDLK